MYLGYCLQQFQHRLSVRHVSGTVTKAGLGLRPARRVRHDLRDVVGGRFAAVVDGNGLADSRRRRKRVAQHHVLVTAAVRLGRLGLNNRRVCTAIQRQNELAADIHALGADRRDLARPHADHGIVGHAARQAARQRNHRSVYRRHDHVGRAAADQRYLQHVGLTNIDHAVQRDLGITLQGRFGNSLGDLANYRNF